MIHSLHKKIAVVLIFALTFTSLSSFGSISYASQPDKKAQEQMLREAKEGEILVKYKNDNQSDTVKTKVKSKLSLSKMEEQFEDKELKMEVISVNDEDVTKTIAELKKNPNVVYAQPNYKLTVYGEPDYYKQWGLNNTGQAVDGVAGATEASIQVEPVWNVSKGEPDVIVGVLDTGVDIGHPELSNHIFTNEYEVPGNGIDDDGNGYIDDVNGWDFYNNDNTLYDEYSTDSHGTMVSGIIAANENNIGIMGISPNVTLLPLKFIGSGGGYTSDAIRAIEYAERMGVSVMNCSFGGPDDNRALKEAMADSDILFICAAGNSGANVQAQPVYPACFGLSNIIPVTSINNTGSLAENANYGLSLIAAPGKNIWTTIPGRAYGYGSGSSFAAAFVTGTVALIKSIFKDLTNLQIKEKIINGLSHLDVLKDKVMGLLSVKGAMYGSSQTATTDGAITTPGAVTGSSLVTTLGANISQSLVDAIHFGEAGVNYATGNYSKTITLISLPSPGFLVNMSFTYNSKDTRATSLMGRGWTFGFEGNLKQDTGDTSLYIAKLPDGSAQTFRKSGSTYTAEDSRSKLEAQ
jgi:subtilisin family serine protease